MRLAIDDIEVGATREEQVVLTAEKTSQFVHLSRDAALIHTDEAVARARGFDGLVVHGFLLGLHFSRIIGMELPGENAIIGSVELKFHQPAYVGDAVIFTVTVRRVIKPLGTVLLDLVARKQDGTLCVEGKTSCMFMR